MAFLYGFLFFSTISLAIAVQLDGPCLNTTQCEDTGAICLGGVCQCNTPLYAPCQSGCEIQKHSAYENDSCEVDEHCVYNANCVKEICQCRQDFKARVGLCLKNLGERCTNHSDCFSEYCSNSSCGCSLGFEPEQNNATCQKKRVGVYGNWSAASAANAFCIDDGSCRDTRAKCSNDTQHRSNKFCQCPKGYEVTNNNTECAPIKSSLLSPLNPSPVSYGECGECAAENALCMKAAEEVTCWCRSGYENKNDRCNQLKSAIIFPSVNDRTMFNYTSDCPNETNHIQENLCVCAPGYRWVGKDRPCEKIVRNWIDEANEYGLCTLVTSKNKTVGENGLCPKPLTCEARTDKHLCTCGKDQFRDLDDPTQCVYYLGRNASATNGSCPSQNAKRNSTTGICECDAAYATVNGSRQCELKLSTLPFNAPCTSTPFNNSECQRLFGIKALLAAPGQCRCCIIESLADSAGTHCYAPLNIQVSQPSETCPLNSQSIANRCRCNAGYYASNMSNECVRFQAVLSEYRGTSITTNNNLTTEDCRTLYTGPVEVYSKDHCQCNAIAMMNANQSGCWYKLNVVLSQADEAKFCPPNSTTGSGKECKCDIGFVDDTKCVRKAKRVFSDGDVTAENSTEITDADCVKLFGVAAMISTTKSYCICKPAAFPVSGDTYCKFLLNRPHGAPANLESCPENSNLNETNSLYSCVCKPGYRASQSNRTCDQSTIALVDVGDADESSPSNCTRFSNNDCTVKYGAQAFCRNDQCFCNRRSSYITAQRCEPLPKYIFPGVHERSLYFCATNENCATGANTTCTSVDGSSGYTVCGCEEGTRFDPIPQTCVPKECSPDCSPTLNFECQKGVCVCQKEYYRSGETCLLKYPLILNQPCNKTLVELSAYVSNTSLQCNQSCERVRCAAAYQSNNSRCVPYQSKDRCVHREEICGYISDDQICSKNENRCVCRPSFYLNDKDQCIPVVGNGCETNADCKNDMICKEKKCICNDKQTANTTQDASGHWIVYCVNKPTTTPPCDGVDRLGFSPVFLVFIGIVARIFLA